MKLLTDEELVKMYLKTQDNIYFQSLYTRFSDKVYRKCLSFVKDPDIAADFTHDIFLKVLTRLSSFNHESRFSTWLYSVTYNYCLDQVRFKKKNEWVSIDNYQAPDLTPNDAEMIEMTSYGLEAALNQMTPDEKALLMLRYQDDFSYKEIGNYLKTSEHAAKMRVTRAKSKLRKYYMDTLMLVLSILARWLSKLPFRFF